MKTSSIAVIIGLVVARAAAAQAAEPAPPPSGNPTSDQHRRAKQAPQGLIGGIGADAWEDHGVVRIVEVVVGGPAAKAGIRSGDIIHAINGTSPATLTDVEQIRGPAGTAVELQVSDRDGTHLRKVRLVREAGIVGLGQNDSMTSAEWQNWKQVQQGTIGGVGVLIKKDRGVLRVVETLAGGPGARAGIRSGDIIQAINGTPAATLTEVDAAKLVRGPAGTNVDLDLSDEGGAHARKLRVIREAVVVGVLHRMLDRGIGLLSITAFNQQTPASVRQALDAFAAVGARGLVIDLRNSNPAPNGTTEADVAGFFVGSSVPLWLERTLGETRATPIQSSQPRIWNLPVVVLVNERTSRNSVRLASALRSAGGVSLVGRKTAGGSAVQTFDTQPDGSARRSGYRLAFTLRDEPISSDGLTPDVLLDASLSDEQQLARAAAVLAPPTGHRPVKAGAAAVP